MVHGFTSKTKLRVKSIINLHLEVHLLNIHWLTSSFFHFASKFQIESSLLIFSSKSKEALAVNLDLSGWPDKKWRLGI